MTDYPIYKKPNKLKSKNKPYSEKLKDPRWQKKRLEVMERDDWSCQNCFDNMTTLSVHHIRYIPGRDPWDYPEKLLVTLCDNCHKYEYENRIIHENELLEHIKDRGFFCDSLHDLACAFNDLIMVRPPEVTATIIKWAFGNVDIMQELDEKYFESLKS